MTKHQNESEMINGIELMSDVNGSGPARPDHASEAPMPVDGDYSAPFTPHAGTKNLSMQFKHIEGSRMDYEDIQTGEHVCIEYVECGAFIVCVIARDKRRVRAMRNNIEDGLEEVSAFDFYARRGWNIVQVASGRGIDGEIGLPIITVVQSGI